MIKRNTVQKMKILDYLVNTKSHPTAEEVYAEVSKDIPTISLSTVYRNLNMMVDSSEIVKFEVGNEAHYDADTSFHHHAFCKSCKSVYDIFDADISNYITENAIIPNFEIETAHLIFQGRCAKCSPKIEVDDFSLAATEIEELN
ncbi:transcriptional repressor [Methanolapillus ohkumae]|uniref:Peroxide operon regulator n=1 Tax=Methanolapillus ohkumae TaxID=3028298 RepID=A0AA96V7A8_9EURY|nr:Peroxide operon regulator [Methanosarcinaceae archaeon Am2]